MQGKPANLSQRERFPSLEEDLGEDPARFLDTSGVGGERRELILARIRGIDYRDVLNAWLAVERRLNGGRQVVVDAIEDRREYLEEHGERDLSELDLEAIREQRREEADDEPDPVWRHEPCGSIDVDHESSMAWFCNDCEQRTNRVERVEEELVADGGELQACPDCDSSDIQRRSGKSGRAEQGTYRCKDCKARFDDPVRRPPKKDPGPRPLSPIGRAFVEADPDDISESLEDEAALRVDHGTDVGTEVSEP